MYRCKRFLIDNRMKKVGGKLCSSNNVVGVPLMNVIKIAHASGYNTPP